MKKYFDEKQSKLIHAWINQADKTPNDYLKFMSNWIAFNAICYNLFAENAVKDRAQIDTGKSKLSQIKESITQGNQVHAKSATIERKKEKIEIDIKAPARINLYIQERYIEDSIFNEFVKTYSSKMFVENEIFKNLKNSLRKNDRCFVINMARIEKFETLRKAAENTGKDIEKEDINKLLNQKILVLCEDNNLDTIKNVLYQIRCNIFHGEKIPGDVNDDTIVKSANPVLKYILNYLINEQEIRNF